MNRKSEIITKCVLCLKVDDIKSQDEITSYKWSQKKKIKCQIHMHSPAALNHINKDYFNTDIIKLCLA